MSTVPVIPDTAPFSPAQKAWLNGFLAGLFSRGTAGAGASAAAVAAPALQPLTILFSSQTGTSERLAKKAAKLAGKRGFAPTLLEASQASLQKLSQESTVLLLTSTYGDGEPPDSGKALHGELRAASGTPLAALRYSVCAFGDSNYPKFCQAGKDFDAALEKLGGRRLHPRSDCDLGQEDRYSAWLDSTLAAIGSVPSPATQQDAAVAAAGEAEEDDEGPRSVLARVIEARRVSGAGSGKQVNHIAFSLAGSGLSYEAGDALSVMPENSPALVEEIIQALGRDGEEAVPTPEGEHSLRKALETHFDLGKPTAELLALLGLGNASPAPLQVIDALLATPAAKPSAQDFVRVLRRLQPRLYSISSSPLAHGGEVHLTVGAVQYEASGRKRLGVASNFLAERALAHPGIRIGIHRNTGFRLPADGTVPVIMVGPGTGIAPFRGFIHERRASGAKGPNWLFFGDQRESTDFLYREELLTLEQEGFLRLSLAWSRDQAEKIYVQTRMLEQAAELWAWLEKGAHLYVCGDASRMAKDVDAALHRVVELAGKKSAAEAADYVAALKAARRYQRDVY